MEPADSESLDQRIYGLGAWLPAMPEPLPTLDEQPDVASPRPGVCGTEWHHDADRRLQTKNATETSAEPLKVSSRPIRVLINHTSLRTVCGHTRIGSQACVQQPLAAGVTDAPWQPDTAPAVHENKVCELVGGCLYYRRPSVLETVGNLLRPRSWYANRERCSRS